MSLIKGVYIIECVSRKDCKESNVLHELLKMIKPKKVKCCVAKTKNEFFNKLNKNNHQVIHISCHGNTDFNESWIAMPKGNVHSEDFLREDRLNKRNVVITGCFLGRKNFADNFLNRTHAESLIAPQREISFQDSALWCVNFYHRLLTRRFSFNGSYKYMDEMFRIAGAMKKYP